MKSLSAALLLTLAGTAALAAPSAVTLVIENHGFSPKEVRVPAGQKIELRVLNKDATPAEFESKPLAREKIIPPNGSAVIRLGPLSPGRYPFVEEYHESEAAAQGVLIVE